MGLFGKNKVEKQDVVEPQTQQEEVTVYYYLTAEDALRAVKANKDNLKYVDRELSSDPTFVLDLYQYVGDEALNFAAPELRDNGDFVIELYKQMQKRLGYVQEEVRAFVSKKALDFASQELKEKKEFLLNFVSTVKTLPEAFLTLLPGELDVDVVVQTGKKDIHSFVTLPLKYMQEHRDAILEVVNEKMGGYNVGHWHFNYVYSPEVLDNEEFMVATAEYVNDPYVLTYSSERILDSSENVSSRLLKALNADKEKAEELEIHGKGFQDIGEDYPGAAECVASLMSKNKHFILGHMDLRGVDAALKHADKILLENDPEIAVKGIRLDAATALKYISPATKHAAELKLAEMGAIKLQGSIDPAEIQ